MGWTDPGSHIFVSGELITATTMNTFVKDNLIDLDRRTSTVTAVSPTGLAAFTTSSVYTPAMTTYAGGSWAGPAAPVVIGAIPYATVSLYSSLRNEGHFFGWISAATSGASTNTGYDWISLMNILIDDLRCSASFLYTIAGTGLNTFQMVYRTDPGGKMWAQDSRIAVTPVSA